jgi:hypothetical protein
VYDGADSQQAESGSTPSRVLELFSRETISYEIRQGGLRPDATEAVLATATYADFTQVGY